MNKAKPVVPIKACTIDYRGRAPMLGVEVKIGPPFAQGETPLAPLRELKAIWDTGAARTSIQKGIAGALGLIPTGRQFVHHAGGSETVETYILSLTLPMGVCLASMVVNEATLCDPLEMLIGMDVIGLGDFAVTNHRGVTVCTFRVPSIERMDFVKNMPGGPVPLSAIQEAMPTYGDKPSRHNRRANDKRRR